MWQGISKWRVQPYFWGVHETEISKRIFDKTKRKGWTNHETKLRRRKRPKTKTQHIETMGDDTELEESWHFFTCVRENRHQLGNKHGARIKEILNNKDKNNIPNEENSVVHEISCKGCHKTYVGETGRELDIRLTRAALGSPAERSALGGGNITPLLTHEPAAIAKLARLHSKSLNEYYWRK